MSRPWNLEGLLAVRVLAAANASLPHIGVALERRSAEVDLALWALVGRTPAQALDRLNGEPQAAPAVHPLRPRVLAALALGDATVGQLALVLGEDPDEIDKALTEAAWADLCDADDPPDPCGRSAMIWRERRKFLAQASV